MTAMQVTEVGPLVIFPASRVVLLHGVEIEATRREFDLLVKLASDPKRVFTKAELHREVWGIDRYSQSRTVDSTACRLRQKLGVAGDRFLINVWGVGYRLVNPVYQEVSL